MVAKNKYCDDGLEEVQWHTRSIIIIGGEKEHLVDGPDADATIPTPAHHHLVHHMHTVHLELDLDDEKLRIVGTIFIT